MRSAPFQADRAGGTGIGGGAVAVAAAAGESLGHGGGSPLHGAFRWGGDVADQAASMLQPWSTDLLVT
ncbi:MAG TPA: hypothetical protein VFC16_13790 [Nakamurella sp.]|nr:hypothetical protein [Nakamurella sp.]